jgi:hypothetical protein
VVIVAFVASPAPEVVVVARAIVAVIVYALGPPSGLNGVPRIAVGRKAAPDR